MWLTQNEELTLYNFQWRVYVQTFNLNRRPGVAVEPRENLRISFGAGGGAGGEQPASEQRAASMSF